MSRWHIVMLMERLATHDAVIKKLGGPVQLARALGLDRSAAPPTLHWGRRGIPARYWHRIAELLEAEQIALTASDLERMKFMQEPV